jgi:hypothetical protein
MRIKFKKGEQRRFLDITIQKLNSPSLRGILQFGINIPYSTLKNYYNESRLMPEELYNDICSIIKIKSKFKIKYLNENWGKTKGGICKSRRCPKFPRFHKL